MHTLLGLRLCGTECRCVGSGGGGGGDCVVVVVVFISAVELLVHHELCVGEVALVACGALVGPSTEMAAHVYLECCA